MALRKGCQADWTTLEVVATAMAAAAGLLDLGLSKVEVVQSIDPTKLQVSLDDCDLLCLERAQQQASKASCWATDGACGGTAFQHPVASHLCPPIP